MYMLYIYILIAIYLFTALNKALHFIALRFNSHTAQKVSVFGVILVRNFSAFSRIRTEYSVYLRIQTKCGKNADQNNSEYGHLRSVMVCGDGVGYWSEQ